MKILITGLSGFIGQHLNEALKDEHEIYDLGCDLLEFDKVKDRLLEVQPEIIIHLAARTEVEKSFYEQVDFCTVNYIGTVNLVESCRDIMDNLKLFVFSSTMETYGWQPISDIIEHETMSKDEIIKKVQAEPFDEDTIQHPNAPYAVSKMACEKYLEYAHRSYEFPYVTLRQTNTYGRKDNEFFVVEQIITQMIDNPDEINLGYGKPYRNFLYIDDLINFYLTIIDRGESVIGNSFCLGPNNALSIEDLVDLIAKKMGWNGTVNWDTKPKRDGEIYCLNSSNEKAKNMLSWEPKTKLTDGLDETIRHWIEIKKR